MMRKAVAGLGVALILLVGCATTVDGRAAVDPNASLTTSSGPTLGTPGTSTPSTGSSTSSSSSSTSDTSSSTSSSSTSSSSSSTSSPTSSSSSSTTSSTSTTPPVTLPAGFDDWNGNLAYRGMSADEFNCADDQPVCYGVQVFSVNGCPGGATVVLDLYDTADAVTGQSSGVTPAIEPGGTQQVVIGDTTNSDSAGINDITC